MPPSDRDLRDLLDFARAAAFEAGRLTLRYFQTGVAPEFKGDDTPVTVADREAERLIRARIEARWPEHGILGEEEGDTRPGADLRWVVDPIDGTKAFVRGVPLYAVLLGLEVEGRVEAGVAYFPALGEMVAAATGEGTTLDGRRVRVRDTPALARAFVSCTDPGSFDAHGRGEAWRRVGGACYHRAGWSDAYGHALVATGRLELMLDPVLSPWDGGPFPVLLREAGGYHGDWSGREGIHGGEGLSTTRALLPEVLALLAGD